MLKSSSMPENPTREKLEKDVRDFLAAYKILLPEAKAEFEAQLNGQLKNTDDKTRKLYQALLNAAKNNDNLEQAIEAMYEANNIGTGEAG